MNIFWKVRLSQVRTGLFLSNGRKIVGRKITESNSGDSFYCFGKGNIYSSKWGRSKKSIFLYVAVKM